MNFVELRQRIIDFQNKDCGRGATAEEIALAKATVGVNFSKSYEAFLRDFGWARFAHESLYGLGCDVPLHLELVKNTFVERNAMRPSLPLPLVPVMNDGSGSHYCLDTSRMHEGECPIVFWDHELEEDQSPEVVCQSFASWLDGLLADLQ